MSEDKLQQDCFVWHWNTYPEKRGLLYHNFNNPRNKVQGFKLKSMGLTKGVADLTLLHNGKCIFIELKTPKGTQQPSQIVWEKTVKENGFEYYIIRTFNDFKKIIEKVYC